MKDCHVQVQKYQRLEVKLSNEDRDDIKEKADNNRLRLKGGLVADGKPAPIGMHTQGSYSMKTMIQEADGDYDIDDGVYFKKEDLVGPLGGEMSALAVRQMVCLKVIDTLAATGKVGTVSIEGLGWAEVDFLNDIEVATRLTDSWA